jgi:glycosyltransferase involved in cell wall biosynthesis
VAVIPNGVDIPAAGPMQHSERRTLLFLGRVHPVKGVDILVRAWGQLEERFPEWDLAVVGPGEPEHVQLLVDLAVSLKVLRATFAGPLYGLEKIRAYQTADLFVLPTHSENFGMAVAEALAAGCPVITTKGAPWEGLVEHRAGWWIEIGVEPLRSALGEAMSQGRDRLAEMGVRGRAWMQRDFSWDSIAAELLTSYRWLRDGGSRPEWIYGD